MAKHKRFECPPSGCDQGSGYCNFCDGGLFLCTSCNCAEGTLPKECPGDPVPEAEQDRIMGGFIDFEAGRWWVKK